MTDRLAIPDERTMAAAADLIATRTRHERMIQNREAEDRPAAVTASEIAIHLAGLQPQNDGRVREALLAWPYLRGIYTSISERQTVFVIPQSRAAASAASDVSTSGRRAFVTQMPAEPVSGVLEIKPSSSLAGRVFFSIALEGNRRRVKGLIAALSEGHPAYETCLGRVLRFDPPLTERSELLLSDDDPLLPILLDPTTPIRLLGA